MKINNTFISNPPVWPDGEDWDVSVRKTQSGWAVTGFRIRYNKAAPRSKDWFPRIKFTIDLPVSEEQILVP